MGRLRKQNLISILSSLFLLTFMQPIVAKADVLVPGEELVDYCFKIGNIDKYSDYLIVALVKSENPNIPQRNQVVKSGECVGLSGYREYSEVYALKKSDVNLQENIAVREERAEIKDFEKKKTNLISATNKIYPVRRVSVFFQVEKVIDIYEITDFTDKSMTLAKKLRKYSYNKSLLIVPFFGMSLIGGVIYWKKSNQS